MKDKGSKLIIKASEIGQFIYCPVAWHLQRQGYKGKSPALDRGLKEHYDMGKELDTMMKEEKKERRFLFAGLALMGISILILIAWLVVYLPDVAGMVVWLIILLCSLILTVRSRRRYTYLRRMRKEYVISIQT